MRIVQAGAVLAVALALAGCQRTSYGTMESPQPAPLSPAPVGGVSASQLPPPSTTDFPTAPAPQPTVTPEQQASLQANAPEVSKEALIGRWTVATGGGNCDVFLALTKWTGGYRAASRGCAGAAANISAWDVQGKQVVLSDSNGNQVASLYQSAGTRYDGSTSSGQPISLSR